MTNYIFKFYQREYTKLSLLLMPELQQQQQQGVPYLGVEISTVPEPETKSEAQCGLSHWWSWSGTVTGWRRLVLHSQTALWSSSPDRYKPIQNNTISDRLWIVEHKPYLVKILFLYPLWEIYTGPTMPGHFGVEKLSPYRTGWSHIKVIMTSLAFAIDYMHMITRKCFYNIYQRCDRIPIHDTNKHSSAWAMAQNPKWKNTTREHQVNKQTHTGRTDLLLEGLLCKVAFLLLLFYLHLLHLQLIGH